MSLVRSIVRSPIRSVAISTFGWSDGGGATVVEFTPATRPSILLVNNGLPSRRAYRSSSSYSSSLSPSDGVIGAAAPTWNLVAHGDSMTQGTGAVFIPYLALLARSLKQQGASVSYKNRGISGQGFNYVYSPAANHFGTLTADATNIDDARDSGATNNRLIVFAGTNDIWLNSTTGAATYTLLTTYISARISAGWAADEIVIVTCLPRGNESEATDTNTFNSSIRSGYSGLGVRLCDIANDAYFASGWQNDTAKCADTIHPNQAASLKIAQLLEAVI